MTTTINNEDITVTIKLGVPASEYSVEELFIIIKDNFKSSIESTNAEWISGSDIMKLYDYLFINNIMGVKQVIEGRWMANCNKGRVYCGEYLDLAIAPIGGIYQNSVTINSVDDLGSWAEMFTLDSLKGKSSKEVYDSMIFELDYAQWVYSKDKILELAELFTGERLSSITPIKTDTELKALKEILADEEKLSKLIGNTLPIVAKDLLAKIILRTTNIVNSVENKDNKTIGNINKLHGGLSMDFEAESPLTHMNLFKE